MDRHEMEFFIVQSIHGELSPQEEALLKEVLSRSPEARQTYRELEEVWNLLDHWRVPTPGFQLQKEFSERLEMEANQGGRISTLLRKIEKPHRKWIQWRLGWNLAGLGLAAALALGVFQIFTSGISLPGFDSQSPTVAGPATGSVGSPLVTNSTASESIPKTETTMVAESRPNLAPTRVAPLMAEFNRVQRGNTGVYVERLPATSVDDHQADFAVHNYAADIPEINTQHYSTVLASYENPL